MNNKASITLITLLTLFLLSACGGDDNDSGSDNVVPELPNNATFPFFSPGTRQLPTPNDLLFRTSLPLDDNGDIDRSKTSETVGDGTMATGASLANENSVTKGIDALDGNSVTAHFDIAFSDSLDASQTLDASNFVGSGVNVLPNFSQNVFLLPLTYPGGDNLLQASDDEGNSVEIPTFLEALSYQTAAATGNVTALDALAVPVVRADIISQDGGTNNVIRITPLKPLLPETKYLVVLTNDIQDSAGNSVVPSIAYQFLRDSSLDLSDSALVPVRSALQAWERLAAGYFGFMQAVFDQIGSSFQAPSAEDIVFSITFTTGGTDSTLKSIAAPETFFEKSLRIGYRQDAIEKLVSGVYNLSGDNSNITDVTDGAINTLLNLLLTSPTFPDDSTPNALFDSDISEAIAAGGTYASIAGADASAGFLMQSAVAEAAIAIHNSGDQLQGDASPFVDIATEALGTVTQIAAVVSAPSPANVFPIPASRTATFFQRDAASAINSVLAVPAPAQVFQGEITLPYFLLVPTAGDGSVLATSSWTADTTIGGVLDLGAGNPAGSTPPSDKITYRYPFPAKVTDLTVPILSVLPDETTLSSLGIAKPEDGWPVIISVHGITADRSVILPLANALAFACVLPDLSGPSGLPCFASIAIDQPVHGVAPAQSLVEGLFSVTDPDNPIVPNLPSGSPNVPSEDLIERHFDFTADALGNPVAMDYSADTGSSGGLFFNLSNFVTPRDNIRQLVIDLLNLNASIDGMDVNADGNADDLDPNNVYFIGHSLGAMNGIPFVAINNDTQVQSSALNALPMIKAAVMLNAGGQVTRLLENSPASFAAPTIVPGLAAVSEGVLVQGSSSYASYFSVFQGVVDSGDPINYAASLADANSTTGILLTEVIGDGTAEHPSDQTIPNAADTIWGDDNGPLSLVLGNGFTINSSPAPLAGTEPLIAQFSAVNTASIEASDGDAAVLITRFTEGSHSTPVVAGNTDIDEFTSGAVFSEIVSQVAAFLAQDGDVSTSIVTNTAVVEP